MYTLYKCSYPFCNFSCYDKEEMRNKVFPNFGAPEAI